MPLEKAERKATALYHNNGAAQTPFIHPAGAHHRKSGCGAEVWRAGK